MAVARRVIGSIRGLPARVSSLARAATTDYSQVGTSRMDGYKSRQLARQCGGEGLDAGTEPELSDPVCLVFLSEEHASMPRVDFHE